MRRYLNNYSRSLLTISSSAIIIGSIQAYANPTNKFSKPSTAALMLQYSSGNSSFINPIKDGSVKLKFEHSDGPSTKTSVFPLPQNAKLFMFNRNDPKNFHKAITVNKEKDIKLTHNNALLIMYETKYRFPKTTTWELNGDELSSITYKKLPYGVESTKVQSINLVDVNPDVTIKTTNMIPNKNPIINKKNISVPPYEEPIETPSYLNKSIYETSATRSEKYKYPNGSKTSIETNKLTGQVDTTYETNEGTKVLTTNHPNGDHSSKMINKKGTVIKETSGTDNSYMKTTYKKNGDVKSTYTYFKNDDGTTTVITSKDNTFSINTYVE